MLCLLVGVRRVYANAIKHCRQRGSGNLSKLQLLLSFLLLFEPAADAYLSEPKNKTGQFVHRNPKRKTKWYLNFNGSVSPCAVV